MFHDEVRCAILEIAAVDQAGDRGVIERREYVPLAVQSAAQARMHSRMLQYLDRHGLLVLRIVALAAIHGAHAAMAQNRHDAIRAHARSDQTIPMILEQ